MTNDPKRQMRNTYRFLAFALLAIFLPLVAFADGNDEQERNRKLLDKARSDPQHYARLIQDLQAFMILPPERQNELRKLDRDLHDEDSASYARLQRALERYNDWLQRLPETERKKIEATSDTKARVRLIKEIREREWVSRLPKVRQEELAKLQSDPPKYQHLIKELHQEERNRHKEWVYAIKHWNNNDSGKQALNRSLNRLQKLRPELTVFVRDGLSPLLSNEERQRLRTAFEAAEKRGQWLEYFTTLVDLADKHPTTKHPPVLKFGPRQFDELPPVLQARLKNATGWPPPAVIRAEGKWPEYALEVTSFARTNRIVLPKQLGPSKLEDFPDCVQEFTKQLFKASSESDRETLRNRQGIWPAYPTRLMALAKKHKMQIPGMGLPGGPEIWRPFRDRVKAAAELAGKTQSTAPTEEPPDVPDHLLREFIQKQLNPEEQAELPSLSLTDPESRALIKERFFERNPEVLERLKNADLKKQRGKGKGQKQQ